MPLFILKIMAILSKTIPEVSPTRQANGTRQTDSLHQVKHFSYSTNTKSPKFLSPDIFLLYPLPLNGT